MESPFESLPREAGMPIMRSTGCVVGGHIWTFAGVRETGQPQPWETCDCGLMTWEQANE